MYEFAHPTPVTVALRAHSGTVLLVAEPRDTVEVSVEPVDGNSASHEAADQTRVLLEGDTLLIQPPGTDSWRWRRGPKLRITARVPAGSSLTGRSASAGIHAGGVWHEVQLDVASAAVELAEATGDVKIDSASGDVALGRVGGSLKVGSASGRISADDVTGDVKVKAASGEIRLGAVGGGVHASTASGDIEVARLRQGRSDVRTASGRVRVGIAPGAGVWLDLNTASGRTSSDLTPAGDTPPAEPGGSIELRIRTASGDIHVHRATADRKAA